MKRIFDWVPNPEQKWIKPVSPIPVLARLRLVRQHSGCSNISFMCMKPSGLMRFRFNPSGEDRSRIYKLGWPMRDWSILEPPLCDMLMDTNDSYLSARVGMISAILMALSSPRGFLSSTSLLICLFCKYLIMVEMECLPKSHSGATN